MLAVAVVALALRRSQGRRAPRARGCQRRRKPVDGQKKGGHAHVSPTATSTTSTPVRPTTRSPTGSSRATDAQLFAFKPRHRPAADPRPGRGAPEGHRRRQDRHRQDHARRSYSPPYGKVDRGGRQVRDRARLHARVANGYVNSYFGVIVGRAESADRIPEDISGIETPDDTRSSSTSPSRRRLRQRAVAAADAPVPEATRSQSTRRPSPRTARTSSPPGPYMIKTTPPARSTLATSRASRSSSFATPTGSPGRLPPRVPRLSSLRGGLP